MKRSFLLFIVGLLCFIGVNCDFSNNDGFSGVPGRNSLALLLVSGSNNSKEKVDKSAVIKDVTSQVANQLIVEGKAKWVPYGDNKCIMAVAPYTNVEIQQSLESALEYKLGSSYAEDVNNFLDTMKEKFIKIKDVPQEIIPLNNNSYALASVSNSAINHYFANLGALTKASVSSPELVGFIPVPFMGFTWLYTQTVMRFNFDIIPDGVLANYTEFVLYDQNNSPYPLGPAQYSMDDSYNNNHWSFWTPPKWSSFNTAKFYSNGWDISITQGPTKETWSQRF